MNTLALKGKRVSQGKTQAYMGKVIGISTATYSDKERGNVAFAADEITAASNDLNLTLSELNAIFFDGNLQCCNTIRT